VTGSSLSPADVSRIALGIEYNGSCFNGYQAQKNDSVITIQESLESALSEVANHPVTLHCAGRTDAGVHATGQVVHFDAQFDRPESAWVRGANAILPPTISICWSRQVSPDFHARFSATSRRYRYIFYNNKVKPAILSNLVTHHYRTLDEKAMHEAAQLLLGENDFTSFRGAACQSSTPMRNMMQLSVTRQGDFVIMEVTANAFLLHMVRNIAGVLQAIGAGMKPAEWAAEVLASKDRKLAGVTAHADGLYLVKVTYPEHFGLPEPAPGPAFLRF